MKQSIRKKLGLYAFIFSLSLSLSSVSCTQLHEPETPIATSDQGNHQGGTSSEVLAHTFASSFLEVLREQEWDAEALPYEDSARSLEEASKQTQSQARYQGLYDKLADRMPQELGNEAISMEVADSLWYLCESSLDQEYDLLNQRLDQYYASPVYKGYSPELRQWISLCLSSLNSARVSVVRILQARESHPSFRMSPGDRMIWSQAVSQMTPCQREVAMEIMAKGILFAFIPKNIFTIGMSLFHIKDLVLKYANAGSNCGGKPKVQAPPRGKVEFGPSEKEKEAHRSKYQGPPVGGKPQDPPSAKPGK